MLNKATLHGEIRANQGGFTNSALKLIQENGSHLNDKHADAYLMTDQGVERAISERKREIQILEKLRDRKMVCEGGRLITVHRLGKDARKRASRRLAK